MLFGHKDHAWIIERLLEEVNQKLAIGYVREFLDFNVGLRTNHSIGHRMLIWRQLPQASMVYGKGEWESKGRKVVADDVYGINLYAPDYQKDGLQFYKVIKVFDLSQTVGEPVIDRIPGFIQPPEMNTLLRWFAQDLSCTLDRIDADPITGTYRIANQTLKQRFIIDSCEEFEFNAAAYMLCRRYKVTKDDLEYPFIPQFMDLVEEKKSFRKNLERACILYKRIDEAFTRYVSAGANPEVLGNLRKIA